MARVANFQGGTTDDNTTGRFVRIVSAEYPFRRIGQQRITGFGPDDHAEAGAGVGKDGDP